MNWLAAIWTLIALIGVLVSARGLLDIRADSRALGTHNGNFQLMLLTRGRREVVRLVSLCCLAFSGLLAMFAPLGDVGRIVLYLCLYAGTAGLVVNSILEQVDRELLRRLVR